jgi:uncharacterized protein (TIGR03435 family)
MVRAIIPVTMLALGGTAFAQSFEVASVKPSARTVGPDYNNQISIGPGGFKGRNVTLKRLIEEAYGVQPHQVSGPKWLAENEYDVEAKAGSQAAGDQAMVEQVRLMLRPLLADRFHLSQHRETRELRVYEMVVDTKGPKIHPAADSESGAGKPGFRHFHGELQQLANLIAVQLSIPMLDDPGKPGIASGVSLPVLDRTGLPGIYDIDLDMRLDASVDIFNLWQRFLQEQLGLKLESRKREVELLVVDSAERMPTAN